MLTLILRSLRFHLRSHLGALLGAAVGSGVLIGALVVGDSVRGSLRDMALSRLGPTQNALIANDHFFRIALADALALELNAPAAPVLQVQSTAAADNGTARANRVQVLGVDDRFWSIAQEPIEFAKPAPDEVVLNQTLASQLQASVGSTLLLRLEKPSRLSREAPISPQEDFAVAARVKVRAIAPDAQWGRFSLQANQVPPYNAFVPLAWLGDRLQLPARANLLLATGTNTLEQTESALRKTWQLADAELALSRLPDVPGLELRTSRVFLDPVISSVATNASPQAKGILTYFVNELRLGDRSTPYSMVTGMGAPIVPIETRDDEILINQWLADDLKAKPGDRLALVSYVIGNSHRLVEQTNEFTIRTVLPLEGPTADRTLMPTFPGLEKAESTRDWDSSLPVKLERIRSKDEEYWKRYRGTPKAFVTLAAAQKMWSNRFGNLTAVRYPADVSETDLRTTLLRSLNPAAAGLAFQPVRQQALAASAQSQDFGQLFLGFSFFLIVAALLLMALLFQFGVEKRTSEIGTLLALGFTPRQVRRLLIAEGTGLGILGAVLGVPAGMIYSRLMLYGLSTIWRSAVGTSALCYHSHAGTLAIGAVSSVAVAWLTIWLALRKQARQPARELLSAEAGSELGSTPPKRSRGIWIGWLASAVAMLMLGWAGVQQQTTNAEVFFLAGTFLLISGLGFAAALLSGLAWSDAAERPTVSGMGVRSATRRRRRSLSTVGLLACGSFIVAAIGIFRLESNQDPQNPGSGTGGFALLGECTIPIVHDLNTAEGRQFFGLDDKDLQGVRIVSMRVRDGDDASCLNLNRVQQPRLLGVRPEQPRERRAFTFAQVAKDLPADKPWLLLNRKLPDGTVPAIGDAASIEWALGKSVGDTLTYTDDRGRQLKLRLVGALANSVLQGSLLISESEFLAHFPSESGYRMFMVDVQPFQPAHSEQVAVALSRAAQDYGLQLVPTTRRLAELNAVQNTFLSTFQVLGGLGLLLGSVGLGVVVLRNVLERRGELALLLAVGFRPRSLKWLVLSEHAALLLMGLFIGSVAAFVAVLPSIVAPGVAVPVKSLALTLVAILASGLLWTWAATQVALRGRLLDALRNE
jgi:ABC-type antimicrobial peptide transport system permease subunit